MFYSRKFAQLLILAVAMFYSCSQSEDTIVNDTNEAAKEGNVVFLLQSNTTCTTRGGVDDSYVYEQGSPDEFKVNVARVYLFDNATKLFVKSVPLTNLTRVNSDSQDKVVYETDPISVAQGIYDVFVTANTYRQLKTDTEDTGTHRGHIRRHSYD